MDPTPTTEPIFKLARLVATYYQDPDELDDRGQPYQELTVGFENMYLAGGPTPYVWLETKRWATTAEELAAVLADFAARGPELAHPAPGFGGVRVEGPEEIAVNLELVRQMRPREESPF